MTNVGKKQYKKDRNYYLLYSFKDKKVTNMAATFTYANLEYLESMSMGSQEMIDEMIQIFIDQVPEFTEGLRELLDNEQYLELGSLAHKAKSSIAVMGMDELANDLKQLELSAKAGEAPGTYPGLVDKFIEQVKLTEAEPKAYLSSH